MPTVSQQTFCGSYCVLPCKLLCYKLTLRKLNDQLPFSGTDRTEYVPLTFSGEAVAPGDTELAGNVSVTTALAPGARFVTEGGVVMSDPEPSVVPAIVT